MRPLARSSDPAKMLSSSTSTPAIFSLATQTPAILTYLHMASPSTLMEDYNIRTRERTLLLESLQQAIGDVPKYFWAFCQVCDLQALEKLIEIARISPAIVRCFASQANTIVLYCEWNRSLVIFIFPNVLQGVRVLKVHHVVQLRLEPRYNSAWAHLLLVLRLLRGKRPPPIPRLLRRSPIHLLAHHYCVEARQLRLW